PNFFAPSPKPAPLGPFSRHFPQPRRGQAPHPARPRRPAGHRLVEAEFSDAKGLMLRCTFEAAGGTGTVPAEGLQALAGGGGNYQVRAVGRTDVSAGAWQIEISGQTAAAAVGGGVFGGGAEYR